MIINRSFATFVILTVSVGAVLAAGPREPLTFQDSGLYCGWNDYFTSPDVPIDFFVVPGQGPFEGGDNTEWNEFLKKARRNGKRVIADLNPQVKLANGEWTNISLLTAASTDAELDAFVRVIGEFFAQVDINELYAVTISEEQVFWNGQAENLNKLYDKLKAKYDVPVYQWYSPGHKGSAPGVTGYPNIRADGWVADEYFLDQPDMERVMRGYTILQKPFIQIIWAGGEKESVPFIPRRFSEQHEVTRKYGIPTAYYTYYGEGGSWGWQDRSPDSLKNIFASVLQYVAQVKTQSAPDPAAWDLVPWPIPTIELAFTQSDSRIATYRENYVEDRVLRVANDAKVQGFADLRWDSSPVQLCPRHTGESKASIAYSFESPFKISQLQVSSAGVVSPGKQGVVSMSVLDSEGKTIKTARLTTEGNLKLVVPGSQVPGQRFKVIFELSGTATFAGDVLAGINFIEIEASQVIPQEKVIELSADEAGGVSYMEDLSSMSIYHTAEIKNIADIVYTPVGLHANAPGRAVEVVQKFRAHKKVELNRVCVHGNADEKGQAARLGIGISLNGRDVLTKTMSKGSFTGDLEIDPNALKTLAPGEEFYIHLFLEGGYGVINSYVVDGRVVN